VIDVDAYEFLKFTRRDNGVLLLEMNRPEKKNSMNPVCIPSSPGCGTTSTWIRM
jgi:hypothetical protein